ncbi:MAG: T9SS type A sorting domain-containing protein [Bacteroidetes bacterium]|nr:T9SS type A sorting domain-containing protein [Bacteroidota bacterium]
MQFDGFADGNATITVYDAIGKQVFAQEVSLEEGENIFLVNISNFAKGIFYLKVLFNGFTRIKKLMVEYVSVE